MFDILDRIMNLDIGQRGVDKLYAPARARSSEALCAAAARHLTRTAAGDCIVLITGSLTRPWVSVSIGETDGPVGVAALARALSYGFNAIPVVITDTSLIEPISATLRAAGQAIVTLDDAKRATSNKRFCSVAVVLGFPLDDVEARREAKRIIGDLVEEAMSSQIPTIGVGDGGNEIGMGAVAEAVHQYVPHGKILCAKLATDVLLPAGVSNWGCYAIQAALAVMTEKPDLLHTAAMEKRLVEAAANAGLVDGNTGKCEPTVDGLPIEVHVGIVELLAATAQRGIRKSH
jgi:hypothetical protein